MQSEIECLFRAFSPQQLDEVKAVFKRRINEVQNQIKHLELSSKEVSECEFNTEQLIGALYIIERLQS